MKTNKINILGAKRFKECRKLAGYTQEELAEKSNYSIQQISYIENGKRALSIEAAHIFAKILNVNYEYLMCESPYRNSSLQEQHNSVLNEGLDEAFFAFMEFLGYRIVSSTPPNRNSEKKGNIYDDTFVIIETLYPDIAYFKISLREFYNLKNDIMAYAQFKFSTCGRTSPEDMSNLHIDEIHNNISTICNEERLTEFNMTKFIETQIEESWQNYYAQKKPSNNIDTSSNSQMG